MAVMDETRKKRRAMTEADLVRLLDVARQRPLRDSIDHPPGQTTRPGGREGTSRGSRTAEQLGWERSLMYKTMVLTGLRRGEMAELRAF